MRDSDRHDDGQARSSHGISIRLVGGIITLVAVALAFYAFTLAGHIGEAQEEVSSKERTYLECNEAIESLQKTSDYLTTQARMFVVTGRRDYLDAYMEELDVTDRRGKAVETLRSSFTADDTVAKELEQALAASDALANTELAAMKLAADWYDMDDLPSGVETVNTSVYKRESADGTSNLDIASNLVLGESYEDAKEEIESRVQASSATLLANLDADLSEHELLMQTHLFQLRISVALLLCSIMVFVLALFMYVLRPLRTYVGRIGQNEALEPDGANELHYIANAYNAVYEDSVQHIEQLRSSAERDPLTGIASRDGFEGFLATHTRRVALLLLDIDNFKDYNSVYGHDVGDAILMRLAEALIGVFRYTDFPCRLENDLFAVIMTNASGGLADVIAAKVERVNAILADEADDLPLVTLEVGVAFGTEGMSDQDIYRAADDALHAAKQSNATHIVFYGEGNAS